MSWLEHLRDGLAKTRAVLGDRIAQALGKSSTEFLEDLEAALIQSDVGVATTQRILQQLAKRRDTTNPVARVAGLREIMVDLLGPPSPLRVDPPPAAVLVLGVNGVGKTTTIGKLAYRLHHEGRSVVLAATVWQNGVAQAQVFHQPVAVTGVVLAKLDGSAKGGVVFAVASELHLPVKFVGIGEGMEDLQEFDAQQFVDALLPPLG